MSAVVTGREALLNCRSVDYLDYAVCRAIKEVAGKHVGLFDKVDDRMTYFQIKNSSKDVFLKVVGFVPPDDKANSQAWENKIYNYVFGVVKNKILDAEQQSQKWAKQHQIKQTRTVLGGRLTADYSPTNIVEISRKADRIQALNELRKIINERYRENPEYIHIMILRWRKRLSIKEVAACLDMTEVMVQTVINSVKSVAPSSIIGILDF